MTEMTVAQITAKIRELRKKQPRPGADNWNRSLYFQIDEEINELIRLRHKLTAPKVEIPDDFVFVDWDTYDDI